jgi:site-specific recombinase
MRLKIESEMCRLAERLQPRHQDWDSLYSDFLETHLLVFTDATDDNWLCTTESKFGLLHCFEF